MRPILLSSINLGMVEAAVLISAMIICVIIFYIDSGRR